MGQVIPALLSEYPVKFLQSFCFGNRDADITVDISHQTFHEILFVSRGRVTEDSLKAIVRSQSSMPGLLLGMGTEAILDGNLTVVKDNQFGNTAKY